jgi:hypothetical protein
MFPWFVSYSHFSPVFFNFSSLLPSLLFETLTPAQMAGCRRVKALTVPADKWGQVGAILALMLIVD